MSDTAATLPEATLDPTASVTGVRLYAKDVAGIKQLHARASNGSVYQLTPTGGGGISGAGTTGRSARFTSPSAIGDGAFLDDGTNSISDGSITVGKGIAATLSGLTEFSDLLLVDRIHRNFAPSSDNLVDGAAYGTWQKDEFGTLITIDNYVVGLTPRAYREYVAQIETDNVANTARYGVYLTFAKTGIKDVRNRTFTFSVWAKSTSGTPSLTQGWFRNTGPTTGASASTVLSSTAWTRCSFTFTTGGTSAADNSELLVWLLPLSTVTPILLWGAQIEEDTAETPYVRNSAVINPNTEITFFATPFINVAGAYIHPLIRLAARQPGAVGNSYSITFVADGVGAGTLDDGDSSTFHYQVGVTTVAHLVTALLASLYISSAIFPGSGSFISSLISAGTFNFDGAETESHTWTRLGYFGHTPQDPAVIAGSRGLIVGRTSEGTVDVPPSVLVIPPSVFDVIGSLEPFADGVGGFGGAQNLTAYGSAGVTGALSIYNDGNASPLFVTHAATRAGSLTAQVLTESSVLLTNNTTLCGLDVIVDGGPDVGVTGTSIIALRAKAHVDFPGSGDAQTTAAIQTTDAVQTTLFQFTLLDTTAYRFEAEVVARSTDGVHRALYGKIALVYREGGGATIQGAVLNLHTDVETSAGLDATWTVSGNIVRLSVTGLALTDINWVSSVKFQAVADI